MSKRNPDPSGAAAPDPGFTTAELDAARAELEPYGVAYQDSYIRGSMRFVVEEVIAGRVDAHTVKAARYCLALAKAADERLRNGTDVA